MKATLHISAASRELGVTPTHLFRLEREGRIPTARRDFAGRIYDDTDLEILRALGVGQNPRRLKALEDLGRDR